MIDQIRDLVSKYPQLSCSTLCENNGVCMAAVPSEELCFCESEFYGQNCEMRDTAISQMAAMNYTLLISMLVLTVVLLIGVGIGFTLGAHKKRNTNLQDNLL